MKRKLLLLLVVAMVLSLALTACVDREITTITIIDGTFDYEYEKDSTPDFSDLKVKVTYSDGKEREVAADKLTLGTLDTSTTGTKQFTITYNDFTLTVDVKVVYTEPPVVVTLDKIEIDKTSVLSKVKVGDTYSLADIKVTATYSDNTTKALTLADLATAVAPDTAVAGAKKLTVSYTEDDTTVNAEMDVTVVGVKTLTLVDAPAYVMKGETLATSGITASVIYTDDTSETLANDKLTFAAFATTEVGAKKLTATYLDGTGEATVAVIEAIGIDISGIGAFTSNIPDGQDIDLAAVKAAATVTVNYGYGTTKVSSAVAADASTLTVTDVEEGGKRYLKFAFGGFEKAIEVLEGAAVIESIAINPLGTKGYVALGKAFDTAGITLTATYTNGTTDTVTAGIVFDTLVTTTAGNATLTARYDGKTATATVKVLPVTSIAVNGTPNLEVKKGGTLDAAKVDALTFTVTYSDGVDTIIDNSVSIADMTKGAIDTTAAGDKTFTVTYKGANGNVPFEVYTEASVAIVGKVEINKGDSLNIADYTFTVTYTNGATEEINGALVTLEAGYEAKLTEAGQVTISFTYGDATGSFNVTVKGINISGVAKPAFMQQFEATGKKKDYLNQANINEYVVGDDNDFIFKLQLTAKDENKNTVTLTNYTSASKVYLVEGSTETLLEGAALATYLDNIDETKNAFNFSTEAIGKTFKIVTIPKSIETATAFAKSFTFKVVDGWNIYSAKELHILTNFNAYATSGTKTQLQIAKDFLDANNIARPADDENGNPAPIAGMIVHGDITINMEDIPEDYIITMENGDKVLYDDFAIFPHDVNYLNTATGKREFTFYGNFFTIYSYNVPIMLPKGNSPGNSALGAGSSDGVSSTELFLFVPYNAKYADVHRDGTFDGKNYQFRMENVHLMDDNPNDPTGSTNVPDRAVRGVIGIKTQYLDAKIENVIIERYYISIFADKAYMTLELDHARLYNAWQNHIMLYADNDLQDYYNKYINASGKIGVGNENVVVTVKNSSVTMCGGPVILSQTEKTYGDGSLKPFNANIRCDVAIDDATEIYTYVTSQSIWFKTFGATDYIVQIEAMEAGLTNYGRGFRVTNPLTGYSGTFLNMIYVNMNAAFGVSGDHSDVDGQLTIGGTLVTNMDADNVALETFKNSGAPVFQSTAAVSGANTMNSTILFYMRPDGTNQMFTNDFASLGAGNEPTPLADPNHDVFSGDYLTMYYMGMGITFGSYHAHSSTGDAFCKPAS